MPTKTPALTRRSIVLHKIETDVNVDAQPDVQNDAYLTMDANFSINPSVLERQFYRSSLSSVPIGIGRKLATVSFRHELKGSGDAARVSKFGSLLRSCGFAQTLRGNTAAALISSPRSDYFNTGPVVTFGKSTPPTKGYGRYRIRVIDGGASGAATVRVSGSPPDYIDNTMLRTEEFDGTVMARGRANPATITVDKNDLKAIKYNFGGGPIATGDTFVVNVGGYRAKYVAQAGDAVAQVITGLANALNALGVPAFNAAGAATTLTVTIAGAQQLAVTSGATVIPLGQSGAAVTMSWAGNLVADDEWTVDTYQPGWHYTPISTNFETATVWVMYDGNLHRLTGCIGSVSITAEAGQFAMATFTYTGQYTDPEDMPLPVGTRFEPSIPQQVELAQLTVAGQKNMRAASFSVDMGITTNPRDSVSHPDGYDGTLYTSRAPTGGLNPEMYFESEEPYWKYLSLASLLRFHARIGTRPGNIVHISSESMQLRNNSYTDRNNNRVYDMSTTFAQDSDDGDDEIRFVIR